MAILLIRPKISYHGNVLWAVKKRGSS